MWILESPWPLFTVFLIIGAGLFVQWFLERRPRQLVASASFLALGGLVILVEPLIVTPRKQVRSALYGLADAFEKGDGNRCADYFSRQDLADRELVRGAAGRFKIDGRIRITDLSITVNTTNIRATAGFRASATVSFQGHSEHGWTRWQLDWDREGKDWKVVRVRRLRFLGGGEVEPLSALE